MRKMKIADMNLFHEGISERLSSLSRLEQNLQNLLETVESFSAMEDVLKGNGGSAIRSFYANCHAPFLEFLGKFIQHYTNTLQKISSALIDLEPDANGYIRVSYLEGELDHALTTVTNHTISLVDETNGILGKVADIVTLPRLNDSQFIHESRTARSHKDDSVMKLNEFDAQQSSVLESVEADLNALEKWIFELEGLVKENLTGVDFPSGSWEEYTSTDPNLARITGKEANLVEVSSGEGNESAKDAHSITPYMYAAKNTVGYMKKSNTGIREGISSFRMYMAAKNNGMTVTKTYDPRKKTYGYRINATGNALKALGVEPDRRAFKDLMHGVPKNGRNLKPEHYEKAAKNTTILKYASKKPGQSGWSAVGEKALDKVPALKYWNDQASLYEKAKTVGGALLRGAGKSLKDTVDIKSIAKSGAFKGATKSLGPIGAGLTYYSNYNTAVEDGLAGKEAAGRAAVDTAIDTAVGGGVQAAFTAAGTVFIPIPGVGTAIGVAAGIAANTLLNKKDKKTGKSVMDKIKGWFH
ncbi:transposase [Rossellomorea vietnamensis]|uniref:Transposase n=1 Tax=Rossellomorea vietnamensis TaxID=218284 RepID=A0A5D4M7C4_9BACI|nr:MULTISPECIES: LXG domain-containing protein [Bacillaceae]TYR97388.1 transposase [Rossellomorea vietnamensis]